ncbi:glycosyl transferase family protein [Novosphingobium sp.]|uniref:glycosyl transferase family protein n=1 Tax=Novosphingobium sp. TaxID=1874826 RepID=UPI0025D387F5|nr:glycosyl transferase family protein [Novosphingobium sp.]MCC6924995.1 glycosyl transferase family protein [Novosphingobium sp.]
MIADGATAWTALDWLLLVERELLAFSAFWFCIGLLDEFAIDLAYLGLRLKGRIQTPRLPVGYGAEPLSGPCAVMIPAFGESQVIGTTIGHMLASWPQRELTLYIGCYSNDPATVAAAIAASADDLRLRLVLLGARGPTTKADCLNRLYAALCADEERQGRHFVNVLLHDAEDMVHPCALQAVDTALVLRDFVQLPVRPEPQDSSRWIAGHYSDEFAENHAKGMVVRAALGASIPAAGVGCGFSRAALGQLAERRAAEGEFGPFAPECLTEDYELGMMLSRQGRGSAFLRLRDDAGQLVATRSYFPNRLDAAVRQKTRWVHGIAFQGWDRMGWSFRPVDVWMALRDRRGPLTALVLASAYLLLVLDAVLIGLHALGMVNVLALSWPLKSMLLASFIGFLWRAMSRAVFTAREYGWREGLRAVLRIPVANVIAIMAGRRALGAYFRSLQDGQVTWDKTVHDRHPATATATARARTVRA